MNKHTHKYTDTQIHIWTRRYTYRYTDAQTHRHKHRCVHMCRHTDTHMNTYKRRHIHRYTDTHMRAHAHIRACTHISGQRLALGCLLTQLSCLYQNSCSVALVLWSLPRFCHHTRAAWVWGVQGKTRAGHCVTVFWRLGDHIPFMQMSLASCCGDTGNGRKGAWCGMEQLKPSMGSEDSHPGNSRPPDGSPVGKRPRGLSC